METAPATVIAVAPAAALHARPRLFAALEAALPVTFTAWPSTSTRCAAIVCLLPDPGAALPAELERAELPVLVAADGTRAGAEVAPVTIAGSHAVDRRVRGITLHDRLTGRLGDAGEILAHGPSGAAWTRSRARPSTDRVGSVLPELGPGEILYTLLSRRAIASVALIQFLRNACGTRGWTSPPLRAAFVFDDPNLRWRSYGFIDYRRLVAHAEDHGYHVAMAMIPLDAGLPHRPVASLFSERSDRLSLVVHGNDHVRNELLTVSDPGTALSTAAQAMRRVQRLERRTGVRVDRIMMPPHGLCSEVMSRALATVGFEALCAIHPQPWTAEPPTSPPLAAWRPSEFVAGCAVIPRMAITSTRADLALRAFLDHPMIVYGHHDDLAGGLAPLAEVAALVNDLGEVEWMSVGDIARSNFAQRVAGRRLHVRPFSGRLSVAPPLGTRELVVERPQASGQTLQLSGWSLGDGPVLPFDEPVPLGLPGAVDIRLRSCCEVEPAAVPAPAWRPWPPLRRAAAEARDRVLPLRAAAHKKRLTPAVDG